MTTYHQGYQTYIRPNQPLQPVVQPMTTYHQGYQTYIRPNQPLQPVVQPIQPSRPEIIGSSSDDKSFLATNTNIYYPRIHPAQVQDQHYAAVDRVYGRPTYYKLRQP